MPAADEDTNDGETSDTLSIPTLKPAQQPEIMMQPFDVPNLDTGDFDADFTGSIIEADRPVIVLSGSEVSDAPHSKSYRRDSAALTTSRSR